MRPFTVPVPKPSRAAPSAPRGNAIVYGAATNAERTSTIATTGAAPPLTSTGASATACSAAMAPAKRSDTARRPILATTALEMMKIAAETESHAPIVPAESPWWPSWSGATRLTTPSPTPPSSMIAIAPESSGSLRIPAATSASGLCRWATRRPGSPRASPATTAAVTRPTATNAAPRPT